MERLSVAAIRQPATALFDLAQESGCFAAAHLRVDERTFELGRDALAFMREDRADLAIAYETPTLAAAFSDERIRVLTRLHTSTRNTRLVALRDRGIEGFSGLAGARIGLPRGSNADYFVDLALRFGAVPRARVRIVDLSPGAAAEALSRGELDAAVLFDPWAARAEQELGDRGRTFHAEVYSEVSLLLTRDDVLRAREGALRRLVRGLACAERLARERPAEAAARIRPRFPGLREDELRAQLGRVEWGLGLDHVLVGVLRDEGDWFREIGAATGEPPDPQRLVAPRLLEQVDPEAVTLFPSRRGGR